MSNILSPQQKYQLYLETLKTNFTKLCKIEFLYPDGSTWFVLDNNYKNKHSINFIQEGSLNVNLQNGIRRVANIKISNVDNKYDFDINKIWFGQQIRLSEGLILPNGEDYYISQGVFYIKDPSEIFENENKMMELSLVDKWSYLDGSLFGNLDGIYEVPLNSNIFTAIKTVLLLDRGNGIKVDNVIPLFTNFYDGKNITLTNGNVIPILNTPYTARVDSDNGTYSDIILEMNTMLAGLIGYNQNGQLQLDPSQDDILDNQKPILWNFKLDENQFLGATYNIKSSEIFNDIIIEGATTQLIQAKGRATNEDIRSPMNIFGNLGRRTKRIIDDKYSSNEQCNDLAKWYLKQETIKKQSITINCSQMFHLYENALVTLYRPDRRNEIERHLITGFTRPLGQTGQMTINATSVNDFI